MQWELYYSNSFWEKRRKKITKKNDTHAYHSWNVYKAKQIKSRKDEQQILIRKHYFKSIFLVVVRISHLCRFDMDHHFINNAVRWWWWCRYKCEFKCEYIWWWLWQRWWIQSKAQVIKHNQVEMSSDLHANDGIFPSGQIDHIFRGCL